MKGVDVVIQDNILLDTEIDLAMLSQIAKEQMIFLVRIKGCKLRGLKDRSHADDNNPPPST